MKKKPTSARSRGSAVKAPKKKIVKNRPVTAKKTTKAVAKKTTSTKKVVKKIVPQCPTCPPNV